MKIHYLVLGFFLLIPHTSSAPCLSNVLYRLSLINTCATSFFLLWGSYLIPSAPTNTPHTVEQALVYTQQQQTIHQIRLRYLKSLILNTCASLAASALAYSMKFFEHGPC